MAPRGVFLVLSLVMFSFFLVHRGIQTWLSPTSLQYPLWHFLWCEWGRIQSYPTQEVYCFCLRRLTQRPLRQTRAVTLCRKRLLSAYSCLAIGKIYGPSSYSGHSRIKYTVQFFLSNQIQINSNFSLWFLFFLSCLPLLIACIIQ